MNEGKPFELVVIDLVYADETFGRSQPMTRYEAEYNLRRLGMGWEVNGKRVTQATIVYLDPQPVVLLDAVGATH